MKAAVYAGSEMKEWFDVDNNRLSVEFTCGHEVHLSTAKESFTTSFSSKFGTVDGGTIFWQGVTQNQFVFANAMDIEVREAKVIKGPTDLVLIKRVYGTFSAPMDLHTFVRDPVCSTSSP